MRFGLPSVDLCSIGGGVLVLSGCLDQLGGGVVVRLMWWRQVEGKGLKCSVVWVRVLGMLWAGLYCNTWAF